jgi:predicted DNA-binding transcriptional regulator AlpA
MDDTQKPLRLLSRKEVIERVGRSYPWIWDQMRKGAFPRSREQGGCVAWPEPEIDDYIKNLPVKRLKGE